MIKLCPCKKRIWSLIAKLAWPTLYVISKGSVRG